MEKIGQLFDALKSILLKEIQKVDENYSRITDSNTFNWACIPKIKYK